MNKMCFQLASLFLNVSSQTCKPPLECSFLLACLMFLFPRTDANHSVSFWKYFALFIINISVALTS